MAVCAGIASPAEAAGEIWFDLPPGSLDIALVALATQAGVSIDTSDPALRSTRVAGLRGRFGLREGLRRLLRGTPYEFHISRGNVVRLLRRPDRDIPVRRRPRPLRVPAPTPAVDPSPASEEVIVTASKQNVPTTDYPGAFNVAFFDEARSLHSGASGSEMLLRELPNLASTNLGSGRNKIFVRGIADSSFNGQLQSTVSQYFGESRLTYSAPDPDLALYDIEKVEVIEGPQGTLYGAGSLGGVIRIMPRPPVPEEFSISGTAAVKMTGSSVGGDAALVANVPIGGRGALRLVTYRDIRPGYIDDLGRGLFDVNRTSVLGVRATFRMQFHAGLSIDAGIVSQDTGSADGQYTDDPGSSALVRRSFVAQPFDNDYRLMYATLRADLDFARLTTNTSYNYHPINTVFDATPSASQTPLVFEEVMRVKLLTHETRLSGTAGGIMSWVTGFSLANNTNAVDRFLGPVGTRPMISSVQSESLDAALFGEATLPLWRNVRLTGGGRLSYFTRFDDFTAATVDDTADRGNAEWRVLPTIALSWRPWGGTIGYLRYQEGYRPGAEQLTENGDQAVVTRFQPDAVRTAEIGMRFGAQPGSRISGGLSYAYSRWDRVQADLVTSAGFPYVANLGSAQVHYISANVSWTPTPELRLDLSGFNTTSRLDRTAAAIATEGEGTLPNVADGGWRFTGRFEPWILGRKVTLNGTVGYVGTSYLGVSAPFAIPQGDYLDTAASARLDLGRWGVTLDVENLLDSRANRFSYGNPFSVAQGAQRTPLRPRTVRIGIDASF